MYVAHHWPVDLWEHKDKDIQNSVGIPYRWPRTNQGLGQNELRPQDPILQIPEVNYWDHHMRRDDNDACGAIPRKREDWPELSAEEIQQEKGMPRIEKVLDAA